MDFSQFFAAIVDSIEPAVRIKINTLLRGTEKTRTLEEILEFRQGAVVMNEHFALLPPEVQEALKSAMETCHIGKVSEQTIREIHRLYGPAGLFQLGGLCMTATESEFKHYMKLLDHDGEWERLRRIFGGPARGLVCANDVLRASPAIEALSYNMFHPSLSRKLYRAGTHHGSIVYGVGGPRILVSHAFHGVAHETYDVYVNTLDVVTSLRMRGFTGTFHFLDLLPGLSAPHNGVPGWLAWFTIIAIHSDLVILVQEEETGLRPAQLMEAEFTPDFVQKAIVHIPRSELQWAKEIEDVPRKLMYVGNKGYMTQEEWYAMEADHAMPMVRSYMSAKVPRDRLMRIDEDGEITYYPFDYPKYQYEQ